MLFGWELAEKLQLWLPRVTPRIVRFSWSEAEGKRRIDFNQQRQKTHRGNYMAKGSIGSVVLVGNSQREATSLHHVLLNDSSFPGQQDLNVLLRFGCGRREAGRERRGTSEGERGDERDASNVGEKKRTNLISGYGWNACPTVNVHGHLQEDKLARRVHDNGIEGFRVNPTGRREDNGERQDRLSSL